MAIEDDLALFDRQLADLIVRYEQYFLGIQKREPLQLRDQVERLSRKYLPVQIINTMNRFRYASLVSRFQTYQQQWNKVVRLIEEGKYSRDRFKMKLHQKDSAAPAREEKPKGDREAEALYAAYLQARARCGLPTEGVTRESIEQALARQRPALQQKYGCDRVEFRVVIEEGKPKIKARPASAARGE